MTTTESPGRVVVDGSGDPAAVQDTDPATPDPAFAWRFARIVGLDMSLASTGIAVHYPDGRLTTATIASKGKRDDNLAERRNRIHGIVEKVVEYYGTTDLIVIEGPAGVAPGGSTWDRAGLWWAVVSRVGKYCPVAVVGPTTRAKWATGNGRADKAAVAVAMARRAPDVELANSDEADALALAWMGAQRLGWRPVRSQVERACLGVAKWPAEVATWPDGLGGKP